MVCFRYRSEDAQRINPRIVIELQESGVAAPSTTVLDGRLAIRAAIVNHRTGEHEIDRLVEKTVELGARMEARAASSHAALESADAEWPPQRARQNGAARCGCAHGGGFRKRELAVRARRIAGRIGPDARSAKRLYRRCCRAIPGIGWR